MNEIKTLIDSAQIKIQANTALEEYRKKSTEMTEKLKKLTVTDEASNTIAGSILKEAGALVKEVDEQRKLLKAPFKDAADFIEETAGSVTDPVSAGIAIVKNKILAYADILEKQKVALQLKVQEEAKEKEAKLEALTEKLKRIDTQMYARLFGGKYKKADGSEIINPGCQCIEDCDAFEDFLNTKFPPMASFEQLTSNATALFKQTFDWIDDIRNVFKSEGSESTKKVIIAGIGKKYPFMDMDAAREIAQAEIQTEAESIVADVPKVKGVVNTWSFEITDKSLVPRKFLCVDEKALKNYLTSNKENLVENDEQTIPGVKIILKKTKRI